MYSYTVFTLEGKQLRVYPFDLKMPYAQERARNKAITFAMNMQEMGTACVVEFFGASGVGQAIMETRAL